MFSASQKVSAVRSRKKAFWVTAGVIILLLCAVVVRVVYLILFGSYYDFGFYNRQGRLFRQTEQVQFTRIGIEVLYEDIIREGKGRYAFSRPGYTSETGTGYPACSDFGSLDAFGNGFYGIVFDVVDDTLPSTNLVIVTKDRAGDFHVMSGSDEPIVGKGLKIGGTVFFIWSLGPDGINSFAKWDDITLL